MKNNEIDKIAIGSGSHKKSRFNLSHDVNSTYQFGEVQPVLFRDMIAGEKDVVDIESMVRLAPMVAPTFGRIIHKEWHHFVPYADLFPHYGNFISQTSYRGNVPTKLPSMSIAYLSYMCLAGARMSIYEGPTVSAGVYDPDNVPYQLLKNVSITQTTTSITNFLTWILESQGLNSPDLIFKFNPIGGSNVWNIYNGPIIELAYLMNPSLGTYLYGTPSSYRQRMYFPIANWDPIDFFDYDDKAVINGNQYVTDVNPVLLDSADAVIPYPINYNQGNEHRLVLLAFRFSNFGKRLYKILTGLGYVLDFESTQQVSLMPIFAFYKAWFDSFGITRNMSWTDTACYKLLQLYDWAPSNWDLNQCFDANVGSYYSYSDWISFIVELGNSWVTEDVDFVSAHYEDVPNVDSSIVPSAMFANVPNYNFNQVSLVRTSSSVTNTGLTQSNPSVAIGNSPSRFSALQIKELMQMYRWLNRNSVAGRACEDILRAQGYGYFLYSCKSNFIGYTEQHVQIYDVVSNSDTFNSSTDDGALLGQYAGRGLGSDKSKTMTFEADEDGCWIGLCAIVPKSGYSQALAPVLTALDKFSRYNPDLDGKYMVLSPKSFVRGAKPFSSMEQFDTLKSAFGFIPIYSGLKIANNVSNGGFSLRSQRKVFEPYMLDKVIDVGERSIVQSASSSSYTEYQVTKLFKDLPISGDFWRYLCRYPWLGNFDRIFAKALTNGDNINIQVQTATPQDSSFEYLITSDDNFMIHHVVNQIAYSPMLPISESFSTEDEDGNFDTSVQMQ